MRLTIRLIFLSALLSVALSKTAVEVSTKVLKLDEMICLRKQGITGFISQTWDTNEYDVGGFANIRMARESWPNVNDFERIEAVFKVCFVDRYNMPCPDPVDQLEKAITKAAEFDAKVDLLWIHIESTFRHDIWPEDEKGNRDVLSRMVFKAKSMGQNVGIRSDMPSFEWIFGPRYTAHSGLPLWWPYHDLKANFKLFDPFNGWTVPTYHEYEEVADANCKDIPEALIYYETNSPSPPHTNSTNSTPSPHTSSTNSPQQYTNTRLSAYRICPAGFQPMFPGACGIRVQNGSYTYGSALSLCHSVGAFLPSVTSATENEALRIAAAGKMIFLGVKPGKGCKWDDDSEFSYKNYSGRESCDNTNFATKLDPEDGHWDMDPYLPIHTVICTTPPNFSSVCGDFAPVDDNLTVCHHYHDENFTWNEAAAACAMDGATLAIVNDIRLNSFVRRTAMSQGTSASIHIGAYANGSDDFQWADGSVIGYDNFANGFPIPGLGNCALMQVRQQAGQWMNEPCDSQPMNFVCTRTLINPGPSDDFCPKKNLYKSGDDIFSPGYPTHYSNQCEYLVVGGVGSKIRVEVMKFAVNTCCASLTIFDGIFDGYTPIATLTGEVTATSFTSTQSSMRISWNSTERQEMLGWHLRVFIE